MPPDPLDTIQTAPIHSVQKNDCERSPIPALIKAGRHAGVYVANEATRRGPPSHVRLWVWKE